MDRFARLLLVISLAPLPACSPGAPPGSGAPTATVNAAGIGATLPPARDAAPPADPPDAARAALADAGVPPGGLFDAYRGAVDPDLFVTMRLRRKDGGVEGGYFYDAKGLDIALAGVLATNGTLTLDETTAGKKTGSIVAHVDTVTGSVAGTWTDAHGAGRALRLEPIARHAGGPAVVLKKWYRPRRRATVPVPAGAAITMCSANIAYPEVFGLADAQVEAAINDKLRLALLNHRDEGPCDAPTFTSGGYAVHLNRGGLLSVSFTYDVACEACAHPSFGGAVVNVGVDTGADLPLDRLLAEGGRTKLVALLTPHAQARIRRTEGASMDDLGMLLSAYLAGDYVLEDKGLRVIGFFRLPHAMQALDGDFGVVLPWASVLPALDPRSPAAAAWTAAPTP